jgi:hypothetical protein
MWGHSTLVCDSTLKQISTCSYKLCHELKPNNSNFPFDQKYTFTTSKWLTKSQTCLNWFIIYNFIDEFKRLNRYFSSWFVFNLVQKNISKFYGTHQVNYLVSDINLKGLYGSNLSHCFWFIQSKNSWVLQDCVGKYGT